LAHYTSKNTQQYPKLQNSKTKTGDNLFDFYFSLHFRATSFHSSIRIIELKILHPANIVCAQNEYMTEEKEPQGKSTTQNLVLLQNIRV